MSGIESLSVSMLGNLARHSLYLVDSSAARSAARSLLTDPVNLDLTVLDTFSAVRRQEYGTDSSISFS